MLEFRVPGSRERAVLFVTGRELLIAAVGSGDPVDGDG
jgi:hypothetical protein